MENSDNRETGFADSERECFRVPCGTPRVSDGYCSLTDEKLASLYSNSGDGEAFNRIAARYGDKILGLALKMIRDHHDAEDVRQEVFVSLLENIGSFKGNSRFSTWLFKIILNACFMKLNKERRKSRSEVSIDSSNITAYAASLHSEKRPEELADYREIMELMEGALSRVTERNRTVFKLRDFEGLPNKEAGEIVGMSVSAVKSQIVRTRLFMRDWISTRFHYNENRRTGAPGDNERKMRQGKARLQYITTEIVSE
ncbi:MAG: RNA polymerase sigma factor [Thermodesulfobacteriota bacterium]